MTDRQLGCVSCERSPDDGDRAGKLATVVQLVAQLVVLLTGRERRRGSRESNGVTSAVTLVRWRVADAAVLDTERIFAVARVRHLARDDRGGEIERMVVNRGLVRARVPHVEPILPLVIQ